MYKLLQFHSHLRLVSHGRSLQPFLDYLPTSLPSTPSSTSPYSPSSTSHHTPIHITILIPIHITPHPHEELKVKGSSPISSSNVTTQPPPQVPGSQGQIYLKLTFKYELDSKEGPSCYFLLFQTYLVL